ncbi:MAG: protein translocase subunit SecF [Candidatus Marinimicrobia bacterium]|nr:protein translocase subunit SecF [Candidatus Neomarinimicrobiota bacterium]
MSTPKHKINFINLNKYAIIISVVIMCLSLTAMLTKGLNLGIDFLGGKRLDISVDKNISINDIKTAFDSTHINNNYTIKKIESFDIEKNVFSINSKINFSENDLKGVIFESILSENISKNISKDLKNDALLAMFVAILLILLYIGFRFNSFFAIGSILALMHDILITLGVFSLLSLEINLPIIAAFLTIIGYSLNDTIVVFDRIRENLKSEKTNNISIAVNKSINETLTRTFLTSITTLIVLFILYFIGSYMIKLFTFALIIGVIIGTYSSIFIASATFIFLQNKFGYILKKFEFEEDEI